MPWPLYLALKQLFPSGRRLPFFTVISIVGIALGVGLMLVSMSIMGGFGHQIKQMIIDTQGEVQIRGRRPFEATEAIEKAIASVPYVAASAPYAQGVVMLEYEHHPAFPVIQGFDIDRMRKVIPFERYLVSGSFDDLDDDSVILSSLLAGSLGVQVGDKIDLYTPLMLERMKRNEILLPREVRVAGIFRIGHQQLDSSTAICSLRLMQDLYGLRQLVHGYNIRLTADTDEFVAAASLNEVLPPVAQAMTWYEANAEFQSVLSFERNIFIIMMSVIVIVAAFAIAGMLLTSVVRKTREIGLLGAMGGKARHVAYCFCAQGLFSGVIGTVFGLAGGFTMLYFRNGIVHMLTRVTMNQESFEKFYQFSSLPTNTTTSDLVIVITFSIIASTLAGLIPAWRAARLKPVEALRSE